MSPSRFFVVFALVASGCAASSASSPADSVEPEGAQESDLTARNDLQAAQQKLVLNLLNDICGDTWCEGDYAWDFKKLTCDFGRQSCTFTVLVTDPGYDGQKDLTYWRSCKMAGVSKFEDMVDTAANGYESLDDGFYDKVSACVDKLEKNIPVRP